MNSFDYQNIGELLQEYKEHRAAADHAVEQIEAILSHAINEAMPDEQTAD